jgi:putative transposase
MSKKKKYKSSSHAKYLLKAHIIFVTKYRKKILVNAVGDAMKQILFDISNESDFKIETMEIDLGDHVHLLIDYPPTLSISSIVNRLKSMSTQRIWRGGWATFLRQRFWAEHTFWSDGYFACSTGDVSTETIQRYIEEQG